MIREDKNNFVLAISKLCTKWFSVIAVLCCATCVQANQNYLVAPSGGDMTGADLSVQLAAGNVTLESSKGGTVGSGNIIINDAVTWSSNNTLTLNASDSVIIKKSIIASGNAAGLVMNPKTANGSEQPTTTGIFRLSQSLITLSGTGPILTIAGVTYQVINSLGAATDATTPPTPSTLQGMAATGNLANNYALGGDIDAGTTLDWNTKAGFTSIGTNTSPFTGRLEGLGHRISNLTINLPTTNNYIGFFGSTSNIAVIQNVGLVNATVTGNARVGGLVGNNEGWIVQCYAKSTVAAKSIVGNLVGFNQGTVKRSYAEGQVSFVLGGTAAQAGSLAGRNEGLLEDCYATGTVNGGGNGNMLGGLVGANQTRSPGAATIRHCYSTGSVSGQKTPGGSIGGLMGVALNGATTTDSYWNTQTSGQSTSPDGTGLTTTQMQTQASFTGFDFAGGTWTMIEGQTYPLLSSQRSNIIYNVDQLQLMQDDLNGNYILGGFIDASATRTGGIWGGDGFDPIGSSSTPFTGSLEGNGYTISNLMIDQPAADNIGLFGYTSSTARINNVRMKNAQVTGRNNVGVLVGYNNATINNNAAVDIDVTAKDISSVGNISGSGGLVGTNAGTINNSYSSGDLTGIDDVGGLVGLNQGQINASYSWVSTTNAIGQAGGLVGTNQQSASIVASYASGRVSDAGATGQIGGLVGLNNGSISYSNALGQVDCGNGSTCGGLVAQNGSTTVNATISNVYATGAVLGSGAEVGGLVGNNATGSAVSTSYATGKVQGQTSVGGLIGNNGGSITNGYWNRSLTQSGVGTGGVNGVTGLTAAQMLVSSNYIGFTLTATAGASNWVVINTNGSLQSAVSSTPAATTPMLATEYSTSISNVHQLQLMLMNLSANYSITADVAMLKTGNGSDVWGALGFVPVGNSARAFTGSVDGKFKKISKLYINRTDNNVGLFGSTSNATISNIRLSDAQVIGGNSVGALVGATSGGTISNSYINGYVSGAFTFASGRGDNIGGLVGYNNGTITQSASTGIAYGGNFVGGLVGYNSGTINNSYSTSNANAREGKSQNGQIYGYVGGLVGYNVSGTVNNAYATGNVISRTGTDVGGLVGVNKQCSWWDWWCNTGSINNSYWDTTTSGVTTSAGGTGLTDAQMKQQSSFAGWDFSNTWQMNTYPTLRNMPQP